MATERQWTGSVAKLPESMDQLAVEMSMKASAAAVRLADVPEARELAQFLADHAYTLSEWADAVRTLYVRVDETDGEVPTNAQGVALARFLRPGFERADRADRHAQVSRAGAGLGDDYLYVRVPNGRGGWYEGGIDREGRVST
jgi:hypothetical protein